MTRDELEGIALRHASADRWLPQRLRADPTAVAGSAMLAHQERGALLDLLRRVAQGLSAEEGECGDLWCPLCRAQVFGPEGAELSRTEDHATDCPAPLLAALRDPGG